MVNSIVIGSSIYSEASGPPVTQDLSVNVRFHHLWTAAKGKNMSSNIVTSKIHRREMHLNWLDFISPGAKCVYWDTQANKWSDEGCSVVQSSDALTECDCNHLTNFAVIMDFNGNLDDADKVGKKL